MFCNEIKNKILVKRSELIDVPCLFVCSIQDLMVRQQNSKTIHRFMIGTIHLRRQHVLGGEGCPHVPMVERSQYIRIKNPLHKHFAGMPMVGG